MVTAHTCFESSVQANVGLQVENGGYFEDYPPDALEDC